MSRDWVPLKHAAEQLGENTETTRLRIHRRELIAEQRGAGRRWLIEPQSLATLVSARGGSRTSEALIDRLESKIESLTSEVRQLRSRIDGLCGAPTRHLAELDALSQERDRYRAEASALREAAIRANAGQRSMAEAVRKMLDAVEENAGGLSELLGPQSPADVAAPSGVPRA